MTASPIACPFCGLVCGDLEVREAGIEAHGCAKAAAGFARPPAHVEHRISGQPASLAEAVAAAAVVLHDARLPLFTGLSVDLAGIRALLSLADRTGAIVDRWQSSAQSRTLAVLQRSGAVMATFGEIANRADVVLLLGEDPGRTYPRFFERLLRNKTPLYRQGAPWVAFLGAADGAPGDVSVSERLLATSGGWLEGLSALGALVGGGRLRTAAVAGVPVVALSRLAERLRAARYGAIIWDVAILSAEEGELVATLVFRILRILNRKTRCVGLSLGGSDNAQGLAQVLLWQAGWPAQVSFAKGVPEHDPWLYDGERLLTSGEVDALLWVAALAAAPPPTTAIPTLALVAPDVALPVAPAVEIRVGVPGLDHGGTMIRADSVIAVPLDAARPSALPSVAAVAGAILDRLAGGPS